ncbi:MAG: TlpA family protein disulfide reductase [Betaproteobacteria bacterium]|nr:TlpA family protein disulfide reductase [Betaproteobacteria bacterium]
MQRAHDTLRKNGISVLTVSLDAAGEQAVKPFMAKNGYTVPAFIDQKMDVARAFGVRAVPFTIVVDQRGMIVARGWGPFDVDAAEFRQYVRRLAAK